MSLPENLTVSDLTVLETINNSPHAISQRELSRRTGLSVGLINAVIKKLVHTGYVKTTQLNRKSLEYLLTPQGFLRATQRSYKFIADTLCRYQILRNKLRQLIANLSSEGIDQFYIHGNGELGELVELFFKDEGKINFSKGLPDKKNANAIVLNALPESLELGFCKVVDLVHELGNGKAENGDRRSETRIKDEDKVIIRDFLSDV